MVYASSKTKCQRKLSDGTRSGRGPRPFRFLDLPAELRNNVYEYYITSHPKPAWYDERRIANLDLRYPGLALSQACKQIRIECRSMCMVRITKWMCLSQLENYLQSFHNSANFVQADNINIDMVDGIKTADVDLLPLFKKLSTHPEVVCTFNNSSHWAWGMVVDYLGVILSRCAEQARDPEWSVIARKLDSIVPRWHGKRVFVNVKNRFKPKGSARKTFEAELLKALDLHGERPWRISIRYI